MSILIPGMEMPKGCRCCPFFAYNGEDDCACIISSEHEPCPLVEIKAPHGRLIDADDFEEKIIEMLDAVPGAIEHWAMLFAAELAKNSTAIVEAEGGGEDD